MGIGKPIHSLTYISKRETQTCNSLDESYDGILGASLDKVFFCKRNHQPSLVDNTPSDTLSTTNNDAIGDRHSTSTATVIAPIDSSSYKDDSLTDVASSPLDGKGDQNHDIYHQAVTQNPKFAATSNEKYSFLNWNENNGKIGIVILLLFIIIYYYYYYYYYYYLLLFIINIFISFMILITNIKYDK